MSEQENNAEELVVLLTGIPVASWSAQERVICSRIEVFRQGTFAAGRVAGLREAADICRARSVYYEQQEQKCGVDDSVRCIRGIQRNESAGCLEQIEQAAQGVKE